MINLFVLPVSLEAERLNHCIPSNVFQRDLIGHALTY